MMERLTRGPALAAVAFAATAAWILAAFMNWKGLAHGVQFYRPDANAYGIALLFEQTVQAKAVAGVVLMNVTAGLLGYVLVVRPIWGDQRLAAPVWLLLAGTVPGTLLIVAVTRIVTLFVPNHSAPAVILVAATGTVLAALHRTSGSTSSETTPAVMWRSWSAAAVAMLVALVFEVQFDRFHIAGEAILFFISGVFLSPVYGMGTAGHWPLFALHYDEAAFLYPIVHGLLAPEPDPRATLTVLYWVTLACGRIGAISLTYIALRGLGVDRLSALVTVVFFVGGSLSLNPLASRILFDSLSPLGYTLHVSRFVVPVLPVILISAFASLRGKPLAPSLVISSFLGVGLSAMPVHVGAVLLWGAVVLALTALQPTAARSPALWRAASASGVVVLVAFAVTYGIKLNAPVLQIGLLLGAVICSALLLIRALVVTFQIGASREWRLPPTTKAFAALSGGYLLGMLLLGNVLAYFAAKSVMPWVWPWSRVAVLDRLTGDLASRAQALARSPYCEAGYDWTSRMLTGHCGSLPLFVRTYGLPFALITFCVAWWLRQKPQSHLSERPLTMMFWGTALALLALPLAFVLFDFIVSIPPNDLHPDWRFFLVWVRSRLVEPWFYGGSLLALALYLGHCSSHERRWLQSIMMAAVAVFALNPTLLPAQLISNFTYLLIMAGALPADLR